MLAKVNLRLIRFPRQAGDCRNSRPFQPLDRALLLSGLKYLCSYKDHPLGQTQLGYLGIMNILGKT